MSNNFNFYEAMEKADLDPFRAMEIEGEVLSKLKEEEKNMSNMSQAEKNNREKMIYDLALLDKQNKLIYNQLKTFCNHSNNKLTFQQVRNKIENLKNERNKKTLKLNMSNTGNVTTMNLEVEQILHNRLKNNTNKNTKNRLRNKLANLYTKNVKVFNILKNLTRNNIFTANKINEMIKMLKNTESMTNAEANAAFKNLLNTSKPPKGGKPRKIYTGQRGGKYYYKRVNNKMVKKYI